MCVVTDCVRSRETTDAILLALVLGLDIYSQTFLTRPSQAVLSPLRRNMKTREYLVSFHETAPLDHTL